MLDFFDPRLVAIRQAMKDACDDRDNAKTRVAKAEAAQRYHNAGAAHRALLHSDRKGI